MSAVVYVTRVFIRLTHFMRTMLADWRGSVSHVVGVCVRCWLGMSIMFHLGMVMVLVLGVRVCHFALPKAFVGRIFNPPNSLLGECVRLKA